MPRGGTASVPRKQRDGGRNGPKKVVIRPYRKPPQLPARYYEETAQQILQSSVRVVEARLGPAKNNTSYGGSSTGTPMQTKEEGSNNSTTSLQTAYTACVHLVSHRYGGRLYTDVVASLQDVVQRVLPDHTPVLSTNTSNNHSSTVALLQYVIGQYHLYTDYVAVLKHVCLPLDRAWQWQWTPDVVGTDGRPSGRATLLTGPPSSQSSSAVPASRTTPSATTTTTASSSSPTHQLSTLWVTGLTIFLQRLQTLKLDTALYDTWLQTLLADWNGSVTGKSGMDDLQSRQSLQQVWYMWQDLGVTRTLPIPQDLERYWADRSAEWKQTMTSVATSGSSSTLTSFLQFCYDKHVHCTAWRPWLPVAWLWNILDVYLVQPHLVSTEGGMLSDAHLYPVLLRHLRQHPHGSQAQRHQPPVPPQQQLQASVSLSSTEYAQPAYDTVQQLWMLASRIPDGQRQVTSAIQAFAKQQGLQCMRQGKITTVEDLLVLQDSIHGLVKRLPGQGSALVSLKSVWEYVVNADISKTTLAEQLAKFLDSILRSNKKLDLYQNKSPSDYGWLQRIVAGLFVPLQAKDVFEAFYKRDLAKRLLWNRVVSMDVEKQVCSLLKAECGAGYTSKMEGMFQDVDWSRETMLVYKQSTAGMPILSSVEMEVQVLTTGYWPVYPLYPNLDLPKTLQEPQDQFSKHYKTKYQGRRITWQYALGHCVVRANGFAKPYELLVSLCQALVLVQFDTGDTALTLPKLMQAIGMEDRCEMERILQSLALGKDGTRILRKQDHDAAKKKKTRMNVDDLDTFCINANFESNARRIRITNVMMKETKEERDKTVEAVSRDRLYLIDAVLVRILKARKTIAHQLLIPEVLEQIKVPAQPADIKKRIESLIEREYMERDSKDRNRYNYLA